MSLDQDAQLAGNAPVVGLGYLSEEGLVLGLDRELSDGGYVFRSCHRRRLAPLDGSNLSVS